MKQTKSSAKRRADSPIFFRRRDIVVIACILLAALVFYFFFVRNRPEGGIAQVTVRTIGGGQTVQEISLAENRIITVEDASLPATLEVLDGRIRFIYSQCPDHVCENAGWLQHEGDEAVCLPAGVLARVLTESAATT